MFCCVVYSSNSDEESAISSERGVQEQIHLHSKEREREKGEEENFNKSFQNETKNVAKSKCESQIGVVGTRVSCKSIYTIVYPV